MPHTRQLLQLLEGAGNLATVPVHQGLHTPLLRLGFRVLGLGFGVWGLGLRLILLSVRLQGWLRTTGIRQSCCSSPPEQGTWPPCLSTRACTPRCGL